MKWYGNAVFAQQTKRFFGRLNASVYQWTRLHAIKLLVMGYNMAAFVMLIIITEQVFWKPYYIPQKKTV